LEERFMFVRWKHRASTQEPDRDARMLRRWQTPRPGRVGNPGSTSHYAYLVESVDGKPRQRVQAYLGCIADHNAQSFMTVHHLGNPFARYWFWHDARAKLDAGPMDAETRERCEATLARVVPPLPLMRA